MKTTHITEQKFANLGLDPRITEGLKQKGFNNCTPIQALALPVLLSGQNIAGQAQTGTGKTLAFLTATFNHLLTTPAREGRSPRQPRAIIMAPTRELAIQIFHDAEPLVQSTGLKAALAYGGESYDKQIKRFDQGIDILIGTTGRIIDFCNQKILDLSNIQVVVLDEADRMFDLGFIKDVYKLFRKMPKADERLSMLFSATLSERVKELAYEVMPEYKSVSVNPERKTNPDIRQELFYPSNEHKMALLQTLLEEEWPQRAIVFANTKHQCETIYRHLAADNHRVGLLTGDVPQKKREQILDNFTKGNLELLVATDVAARGIDVSDVTHVFNFDLPDDCEEYTHRIGRTGRAGKKGLAISFACERYAINLPAIETSISYSIPVSKYDPSALLTDLPIPLAAKPYKHTRRTNTGGSHADKKRNNNSGHRNNYKRNRGPKQGA